MPLWEERTISRRKSSCFQLSRNTEEADIVTQSNDYIRNMSVAEIF